METGKMITSFRDYKSWSQINLANNNLVFRLMIGINKRSEAVPFIDAPKEVADTFDLSL